MCSWRRKTCSISVTSRAALPSRPLDHRPSSVAGSGFVSAASRHENRLLDGDVEQCVASDLQPRVPRLRFQTGALKSALEVDRLQTGRPVFHIHLIRLRSFLAGCQYGPVEVVGMKLDPADPRAIRPFVSVTANEIVRSIRAYDDRCVFL